MNQEPIVEILKEIMECTLAEQELQKKIKGLSKELLEVKDKLENLFLKYEDLKKTA